MSEMSAEKKKEIEKYIIKSYFGGGKNVESLANGADVIKGTDDGCIPQLIVEVTYFGESGGIVMIKWNIYGDSLQNSFTMRICREREIEHNRCDSVDAMAYAWEAWRSKIQDKPIFLKTNDEDLQKDKRIEKLEKEVESLRAEKEELNEKLHGFDPIPEYKELLEKLYSTEDVEKLEWTLNHICGGRASVNGWMASAKFWKQNCQTISKLVGFSSVEEIEDYLVNEVECDTLREAISKLHDEVKYASDKCMVLEQEAKIYAKALQEWKEGTGCPSPSSAKTLIESMNAALRESNRVMVKELENNIDEWQKATGRIDPEAAKQYIDRLEGRLRKIHSYSVDW